MSADTLVARRRWGATALPVTRVSIREAISRRLVLLGVILSLVFLGLFTFGFVALDRAIGSAPDVAATSDAAFAPTFVTVLGLFIVRFLAALLAVFLSSSAIAAEIDSGVLHAVLARPLSRTSWLAQRWLAFAAVTAGYVTIMTVAVLTIASVVSDYVALDPYRAVAVMVLELAVLLAIGLAASTTWSAVTSGVVTFSLFGVAWLAGVIEIVGDGIGNRGMQLAGVITSLVIPSDALWRGASFYLQSPAVAIFTRQEGAGTPFTGTAPPTTQLIVWAVGYTVVALAIAAWRLNRRDL